MKSFSDWLAFVVERRRRQDIGQLLEQGVAQRIALRRAVQAHLQHMRERPRGRDQGSLYFQDEISKSTKMKKRVSSLKTFSDTG